MVAAAKRTFGEFADDQLTDRAAALTYYAVLSIFPGLLVVVSLLGLLGKSATQPLITNLTQAAPSNVQQIIKPDAGQPAERPRERGLRRDPRHRPGAVVGVGLHRGLHAGLQRHL